MAVVRYDPWSLMTDLQSEMNRLFDTRLSHGNDTGNVATSDWAPAVDIREETDRFIILADVPGVEPGEIDVHMENGVLAIRGERKEPEAEKATYKRTERAYGTFYRRFSLPDTADADRISAASRNGVLQVVIPKQEKVQPRKIAVEG